MTVLEWSVLRLEDGLVLLDGRVSGRDPGAGEAPGDEPVGRGPEGVEAGQGGVQPGLGGAEAGVDEGTGHRKLCWRTRNG